MSIILPGAMPQKREISPERMRENHYVFQVIVWGEGLYFTLPGELLSGRVIRHRSISSRISNNTRRATTLSDLREGR